MKLTPEQFKRYQADPLAFDAEMRKLFAIPDNRYYCVTTWPEARAGEISVDKARTRVVAAKKISKSDQ
jgi:hypothetical protein